MIKAEEHLNLVHYVLKKHFHYNQNHQSYEDLFQIGCYGLVKSALKFNPDLGNSFATYAFPQIVGYIKDYLRNYNPIKISRKYIDIHANYQKLLNCGYTEEEIIKKLNITFKLLDESVSAFNLLSSLDFTLEEEKMKIHDIVADKSDLEYESISKIQFQEKLKIIKLFKNGRYYNILILKLKGIKSQQSIANILKISQTQVNRDLIRLKNEILPLINKFYDGEITENQFILATKKYRRDNNVSIPVSL